MGRRLCAALFLALLACLALVDCAPPSRRYFTESRSPQSVSDPFIQAAAKFAVEELQLLSDSGVYSTLTLQEVLDASTQLGDFHYVTHLRVALASPHFASRAPVETFDMMVLERKAAAPGDGRDADARARSIAIDEFPVMDEAATEQFWIRKVEDRRRRRRALFAQWERDTMEETEPKTTRKKTTLLSLEQLEGMATSELRALLESHTSSKELRAAVSRVIDERLERLERLERASTGARMAGKDPRDEL